MEALNKWIKKQFCCFFFYIRRGFGFSLHIYNITPLPTNAIIISTTMSLVDATLGSHATVSATLCCKVELSLALGSGLPRIICMWINGLYLAPVNLVY